MPNRPAVSVIIPVRNRRHYLREAVSSLFEEGIEREAIEIVIVDDGSTDGSLDSICDDSVRAIKLARPMGLAHARNVGVAASRGNYVTFLDSDDRMVAGSLSHRRDWLDANPNCPAVAGRVGAILDAEGNRLSDSKALLYPPGWSPPTQVTLASWRNRGSYFFPSWCLLFRRETLEQVGPFDETIDIAVEREFVFRLLRFTPVDFLPIEAVHYRWHSENLSIRPQEGSHSGYVDREKSLAERFLIDAANEALE